MPTDANSRRDYDALSDVYSAVHYLVVLEKKKEMKR